MSQATDRLIPSRDVKFPHFALHAPRQGPQKRPKPQALGALTQCAASRPFAMKRAIAAALNCPKKFGNGGGTPLMASWP